MLIDAISPDVFATRGAPTPRETLCALGSTDRKKVAPMYIRTNTSPAGTVAKPAEGRYRGFSAPPTTADTGKVRLCGLTPTLVSEPPLSKAFIDDAIRSLKGLSGTVINHAAEIVAAAMIAELQVSGQFVLAGVGTFTLGETKAAGAAPTTDADADVQKTVRFAACSSVLCQV